MSAEELHVHISQRVILTRSRYDWHAEIGRCCYRITGQRPSSDTWRCSGQNVTASPRLYSGASCTGTLAMETRKRVRGPGRTDTPFCCWSIRAWHEAGLSKCYYLKATSRWGVYIVSRWVFLRGQSQAYDLSQSLTVTTSNRKRPLFPPSYLPQISAH